MKLAGWILLPSFLAGLLLTVALMILTFQRLKAAPTPSVSLLSHGTKLAVIPTFVGIALSLAGLILLVLARRAARRRH